MIKDLPTNISSKENFTMKKLVFVLAIAAVFVLAFAGSAFAISPAYTAWNAGGANTAVPTPHAGYTLNTTKCAVCHSVHAAAATDTVSAQPAQLLLRSSASGACSYCHIQTAIGGIQLYSGNVSYYNTADAYGHNGGAQAAAACTECHSVHSAGTLQNANYAAITDRILKTGTYQTTAGIPNPATTAAGYQVAISSWCTRCHWTWSDASETTITGTFYATGLVNGEPDGYGPHNVKNHPLKSAETTGNFVAAGATTTTQVAWAGSESCRTCHDAGVTPNGNPGFKPDSFPHHTPGAASFLLAASDASRSDVTSATTASVDGACLKCHVSSNGNAGVGETY